MQADFDFLNNVFSLFKVHDYEFYSDIEDSNNSDETFRLRENEDLEDNSDVDDLHNTAIIEDPADNSLWITLRPEEEHEELEDEHEELEDEHDELEDEHEELEEEPEDDEDIHNTAILEDDEEYENDEFNADVSVTSHGYGPFTCPNMIPMSTPNVTNETMTSFFINLTSASQTRGPLQALPIPHRILHDTTYENDSSRDNILPTPPRPISPDQLVPSRQDSESEPDSPIIKSRSSRITDSD